MRTSSGLVNRLHQVKTFAHAGMFMLATAPASLAFAVPAGERIDLDKTTIKGNAELPKYMYVVPWRDKTGASLPEKKLRLHNLYGDLFDPVKPQYKTAGTAVTESRVEFPPAFVAEKP